MEFLSFVSVLLFLAVVLLAKGIKIVSQSDVYIIERLGRYHKTLSGGISFLIPIVDSVRSVLTIQEQLIEIPSQSVITKDNVNITIDGIVFCKVQNGQEATYNIVNFKSAIANLAMTTLRSEIGSLELDNTLSNRETLNQKLLSALDAVAVNWGLKITRVEISDIKVPPAIERAMNLQMEAEREKRAVQTKAEGQKEAAIRSAEGFKQEQILKAEAIERMADATKYEQIAVAQGQEEAMRIINGIMIENEKAAEFLLAKDRIAAFKALAESGSTDKMILPYDVAQMVGSMSIVGDAIFGNKKQS